MRLYVDDVLVTDDAAERDVMPALARLRRAGEAVLELHDGGRELAVRREGGAWFVEVADRDKLRFGAVVDEARAAAACREFLAGGTPMPSPKLPRTKGGQGLLSITAGDPYHPDCPLCRMLGVQP